MLLDADPNGEQAKLVKQEQQSIDAQYDKKLKGAEISQKMSALLPPVSSASRLTASSSAPIRI